MCSLLLATAEPLLFGKKKTNQIETSENIIVWNAFLASSRNTECHYRRTHTHTPTRSQFAFINQICLQLFHKLSLFLICLKQSRENTCLSRLVSANVVCNKKRGTFRESEFHSPGLHNETHTHTQSALSGYLRVWNFRGKPAEFEYCHCRVPLGQNRQAGYERKTLIFILRALYL